MQQRLGIAILFITHDLRVAAQICDDVAVMKKGRIVEYGPAETVLRHPSEAYTRELIDAAPGRNWDFANFRRGRRRGGDGKFLTVPAEPYSEATRLPPFPGKGWARAG